MKTLDRCAGLAALLSVVFAMPHGPTAGAADLRAVSATTQIDGVQRAPRTGEAFQLWFNFTNTQMPGCTDYAIRLTVNGRAKTARVPWGCGGGGSWILLWGVWAETTPGLYPMTIELDPDDEIAETNENNNTFIGFVLVEDWAEPPILLEWPMAGRFGDEGDISAGTFMDLAWFQTGEILTTDDNQCAYDGHRGNDFGLADGLLGMDEGPAPVFAARDGVVTFVQDGLPDRVGDCNLGCGNQVTIDHGGGLETIYCHLQAFEMRVGVGDGVVAGQEIGSMGNSGCSSGPHLHFEVRLDGTPVDPFVGPNNPAPHVRFRSPPERTRGIRRSSAITKACEFDAPREYYFFPGELLVNIRAGVGIVEQGSRLSFEWWQNGSRYHRHDLDPFDNDACSSEWLWCGFRPDVTGPGEVRVLVDDEVIGSRPYQAVAAGFEPPANTPPTPITAGFREPPVAGRPAFAEVTQTAFDIEYDPLLYRYEWYVEGSLVRTRDTLALTDAIPVPLNACGATLACVVTVSDGSAMADPALASGVVLGADGEPCTCGPADLAPPFGTLDLADLVAFITAFNMAEPAADFAPPFGVFDLADVVAFVTAFNGGCP